MGDCLSRSSGRDGGREGWREGGEGEEEEWERKEMEEGREARRKWRSGERGVGGGEMEGGVMTMKTSPPTPPSSLSPLMIVVSPSLRGWNNLGELPQLDSGVEGPHQ